jgi:hypothetical protein
MLNILSHPTISYSKLHFVLESTKSYHGHQCNNAVMSELIKNSIEQADGEIGLTDIIQFFTVNKSSLVIGACVCGALGLIYGLISPKQYEGSMSIQVAMVENQPIETTVSLNEKLKIPQYFSSDTFKACKIDEETNPNIKLVKYLNPKINKNLPIISFVIRHSSEKVAVQCLEAVLEDIANRQKILSAPIIYQKQMYLANLKSQLVSAQQIEKYLLMQKHDLSFKDNKLVVAILAMTLQSNQVSQVQTLRTEISKLELSLSEPQTKETSLVTPIFVNPLMTYPLRILISTLIGFLTGFILSVVTLLVRNLWGSLKSK